MTLRLMTVTDAELPHLIELTPGTYRKDNIYIGYAVPGDGPADAKRTAIYDRECLEFVYDPNEIYLYGIPPTALEHREKHCLYCGKPLPLPPEKEL